MSAKKGNRYPRTNRKDPATGRYRTTYRHRDMASLVLGRPLKPGEVVHHENDDKSDWHPDNLRVFSSNGAHSRYHHYLKREASGVGHLFSLEAWLAAHGEEIL